MYVHCCQWMDDAKVRRIGVCIYLEPLGHIAAVAGGEDDGVEVEHTTIGELGMGLVEAGHGRHDVDVAVAYTFQGAVVEHRRAAVGLLELERAGSGGAADAKLGEVSEYEPREEDHDLVDDPEREPAHEEHGKLEGGLAEHLAGEDVDGVAHNHGGASAVVAEVE